MFPEAWIYITLLKIVTGDSVLPIGVSLKNASSYSAGETFTCLDGSRTIPYEYVNDDYCDCDFDGSDEPGTSACPNGLFHCKNLGFISKDVPSSRVNDGICDCCDGSDEYNSSKTCLNICDILGLEARKEEERMRQIYTEGHLIRTQLIEKGAELKKERRVKYEEVLKQVQLAEVSKQKIEQVKTEKEEAEKAALDVYKAIKEQQRLQREQEQKEEDEQEALKTFNAIDKNGDNKIDLEELKEYQLRHYEDKIKSLTEEEAKLVLGSDETMNLESFISSGWLQFKQLNSTELFQPPVPEQDISTQETLKHDAENDQLEHQLDEENEEDDEPEEADTHDDVEPVQEPENVEAYDEHTLKLIDEANNARAEFEEADRAFRDLNREVKQLDDVLHKDYGSSDEFAYMDGECYELTDKEYVYRICPFDQVTQRQKNGGSEVRLGRWQNWNNGYRGMSFTNGQSCWNGPNRQAEVILSCGLETEITQASEPSRCIYLFHMNTPAACVLEHLTDNKPVSIRHDEL